MILIITELYVTSLAITILSNTNKCDIFHRLQPLVAYSLKSKYYLKCCKMCMKCLLRHLGVPSKVGWTRGFKRRRPFIPDPTSCVGCRKNRRKEKVYEVQNTVVCNFIVHKSAPRTRLATHKGTYKGKRDHCLIAVELLCMCHVVGR